MRELKEMWAGAERGRERRAEERGVEEGRMEKEMVCRRARRQGASQTRDRGGVLDVTA